MLFYHTRTIIEIKKQTKETKSIKKIAYLSFKKRIEFPILFSMI